MGGTLAAIEGGFQQRQIQESAYRVQRAIESGDQVVVGLNRFQDAEEAGVSPPIQRIDPDAERRQVEGVRRVRAERDAAAWAAAMRALGDAAVGRSNVLPADHRRGQGRRHAGRDQRPAAGRLGRAPRADHRLMATSGSIRRFGRSTTSRSSSPTSTRPSRCYATRSGCPGRRCHDLPADGVRVAFLASAAIADRARRSRPTPTPVWPASSEPRRGPPPRLLRGRRPGRHARGLLAPGSS